MYHYKSLKWGHPYNQDIITAVRFYSGPFECTYASLLLSPQRILATTSSVSDSRSSAVSTSTNSSSRPCLAFIVWWTDSRIVWFLSWTGWAVIFCNVFFVIICFANRFLAMETGSERAFRKSINSSWCLRSTSAPEHSGVAITGRLPTRRLHGPFVRVIFAWASADVNVGKDHVTRKPGGCKNITLSPKYIIILVYGTIAGPCNQSTSTALHNDKLEGLLVVWGNVK